MAEWSFLTNHARGLLFMAANPEALLREIAEALGVTERTAFSIVTDLTEAGYVAKEKKGRRNLYHVQAHLPVRDSIGQQERAVGELVNLFLDNSAPAS